MRQRGPIGSGSGERELPEVPDGAAGEMESGGSSGRLVVEGEAEVPTVSIDQASEPGGEIGGQAEVVDHDPGPGRAEAGNVRRPSGVRLADTDQAERGPRRNVGLRGTEVLGPASEPGHTPTRGGPQREGRMISQMQVEEPAGRTATDDARSQTLAGIPVADRRLELAGIRTAVLEDAEGPPVVLLHGHGDFLDVLRPVLADR